LAFLRREFKLRADRSGKRLEQAEKMEERMIRIRPWVFKKGAPLSPNPLKVSSLVLVKSTMNTHPSISDTGIAFALRLPSKEPIVLTQLIELLSLASRSSPTSYLCQQLCIYSAFFSVRFNLRRRDSRAV